MKIQFLGTAAYEGIPALFCQCETCKKARERGGKNLRTPSQAIIDDNLLIDFPADTIAHSLAHCIDFSEIQDCLITHTHSDHLYLEYLPMLIVKGGYSHPSEDKLPFRFYGSYGAMLKINAYANSKSLDSSDRLQVNPLELYKPAQIGDYRVTALKAIHDEQSFPVIYLIEDSEGKALLYGNDTGYFCDEVWDYLEKIHVKLSLVSLDCCAANTPELNYDAHMCFNDNLKIKNRLMEMGCADENTIFLANHFSHNGEDVLYEEFSQIAAKKNFLATYDGMTVEF